MKNETTEDLMIPERKLAQSRRIKPGELLQGVYFSVFTAQNHLKSVEILVDKGQYLTAYNLLVLGLEELSKFNSYMEMLFHWDKPDLSKDFKKQQNDHVAKLEKVLSTVRNILNLKSTKFEVKGDTVSPEKYNIILETLLEHFAPEAAEKYHALRLGACYTQFNGETVSSPEWIYDKSLFDKYFAFAIVMNKLIEIFLEFSEKHLDIFHEPITKCYKPSSRREITAHKREINRRMERFMPAMRVTFLKYAEEKLNIKIDINDFDVSVLSGLKDIKPIDGELQKLWGELKALMKSHEPFEQVVVFPPLKETAKEYYKQFTQEVSKTKVVRLTEQQREA